MSTITMQTVETVLNKTFKSEVTTPLSLTLYQENVISEPPTPDSTSEYCELTVNYGGTTKHSVGEYQREGIMEALIFIPLGVGTGRAITIAEQIINVFQDAQFADNVLVVSDVFVQKVGKSGSFYQTNVLVSFSYTETQ